MVKAGRRPAMRVLDLDGREVHSAVRGARSEVRVCVARMTGERVGVDTAPRLLQRGDE
jgi:hypothetical protein